MDLETRPITVEEFPAFARTLEGAFGFVPDEEELERDRLTFEFDRSLAVFDGSEIVGTAGVLSFELTLPGLVRIPVAGVSAVSVRATHRRRGILTTLMRRQLSDIAERGEAVALLYASESGIYGRFGYGLSMFSMRATIDRRFNQFDRGHAVSGRVRLVDRHEAAHLLPAIHESVRLTHPGRLSRSEGYWARSLQDPPAWRRGMSERFIVIHQGDDGVPDGYVTYRLKQEWPHGNPEYILHLSEFVSAHPPARIALWDYALNVDLVATIEAGDLPVDEPLRWVLANPRRLRVSDMYDSIWTRLVQPAQALASRRYAVEDHVVFEVTDRFLPHNTGRYEVEGGPDGASAVRTERAADLAMEIVDLGAAYQGGVSFRTLARAGRVHELRPGALTRADLMFLSDPAPFCGTHF